MTAPVSGGQAAADFDITAIVIDEYAECPPLGGLTEEAAEIERLLTELGGIAEEPRPPGRSLDERGAKARLRNWAKRRRPSSVLLWLGHGASDGVDAWLACYDTPGEILRHGLVPQTIADQIIHDWHRREPDETAWALVLVEACGAGIFVSRLNAAAEKVLPRRIAMVGVSADGASYVGELYRAMKRARDTYENNDERIPLHDFLHRLGGFLKNTDQVLPRNLGNHFLRPKRLVEASLSAPVDVYREWTSFLAELTPDERSHFIPKAHGAGHGEFGWHFIGRVAERQRIASWLRAGDGGMLVVTGSPGCGKSALLGNLLVLGNPVLRDLLVRTGRLAPSPPDELPPDHAFDAVVHLAGMSTSDLARRLCEAAGVPTPPAKHVWSEEDVDQLVAGLAGRSFTVLADALDEARDPVAIAGTVLNRLAHLPRGRVIVGTRAASARDRESGHDSLISLLAGASRAHVIWLAHDPVAIETYVRQRLVEARGAGRIDVNDDVISAVARRLGAHGDRGDRQFLFARLAIHELIAEPALLASSASANLATLLDGDQRTLFDLAVSRLTTAAVSARPLLEALALAQGRGVPRSEGTWAQMASALAGSRIGEHDIDDLLAAAGPYIMLDAEYGFSVYRLAHETFRELIQSGAGGNDER